MASTPSVIGIYGLSGSGKSFILAHLKRALPTNDFLIVEGSDTIASIAGSGGLQDFKTLGEERKQGIRGEAIHAIRGEAARSGSTAVVAGHYSFWEEGEARPRIVWTDDDARIYTHVVFLAVDPAELAQRRKDDLLRERPRVSVEHLRRWQEFEELELRKICRRTRILFLSLKTQPDLPGRVAEMCAIFRNIEEQDNGELVRRKVDQTVGSRSQGLSTVLLVDGDKTLSPADTGSLFWRTHPALYGPLTDGTPAELIFRDAGYSRFAFWQASLLYEEALRDEDFRSRCRQVAREVRLFPEFETLLRRVAALDDVLVIVITSGIAAVWECIVEDLFSEYPTPIRVIGGGRLSSGYVITPEAKGQVASRLRNVHGLRVLAFGDSPIDLPMLEAADDAIVVVGAQESRSRSMENALLGAIVDRGLHARQLILPRDAPPRIDLERLPRVHLDDVLADLTRSKPLRFVHATEKAACKILASPTRNPDTHGPLLQKAYKKIGAYLAVEHLTAVLGLAERPDTDVQGRPTTAYALRAEASTAIVAIMRAGEPLARGIADVFPRSRFLHASEPAGLTADALRGISTVLLVDTVVNTGQTIIEFVEHVGALDVGADSDPASGVRRRARVLVVAGVVQAETVREGHRMARVLARDGVTLVALRVSENKYKGTRGLDTGNRMFNTTHRD